MEVNIKEIKLKEIKFNGWFVNHHFDVTKISGKRNQFLSNEYFIWVFFETNLKQIE